MRWSDPRCHVRCRPRHREPIVQAVAPLLSDPVRAVRIEAARALAGIDPSTMTQDQRNAFDSAYRELVAAEMVDADRPEAHLNLGLLDVRRRHRQARRRNTAQRCGSTPVSFPRS